MKNNNTIEQLKRHITPHLPKNWVVCEYITLPVFDGVEEGGLCVSPSLDYNKRLFAGKSPAAKRAARAMLAKVARDLFCTLAMNGAKPTFMDGHSIYYVVK